MRWLAPAKPEPNSGEDGGRDAFVVDAAADDYCGLPLAAEFKSLNFLPASNTQQTLKWFRIWGVGETRNHTADDTN